MTSSNLTRKLSTASSLAVVAGLVLLFARHPALIAQSGGERWVGTWSTSEVGRPQTPPLPVQGPPPFMRNECPAGPPLASGSCQATIRPPGRSVLPSVGARGEAFVWTRAYGTSP